MSNMPDELKEAFETLSKYQYHVPFWNDWSDFTDLRRYKDYKFRLKKEKPLTVEEALKLERVYIPFVSIYAEPDYDVFGSLNARKAWAEKSAAYKTREGAIAHAQMWLDMKVEE